jgi:integrase/recombinase XerD
MNKNTEFVKRIKETLTKKYNSSKTISIYLNEIKNFIQEKNPYLLNNKDIEEYLLKFENSSRSKQNQVIASLKFLYLIILKRKNFKYRFIRAKKKEKIPFIYSKKQTTDIIYNIKNLKHKTICSLIYSCGLRISEIINLKIEHILKGQNLIKIENGKGGKDRLIPISNDVLNLLRKYYIEYKPKIFLFEGYSKNNQYSCKSINNIIKNNFGNKFHAHLLRHSYATHMVENNVEISKIQKLMGHKNISTTQLYMKTANIYNNIPFLL